MSLFSLNSFRELIYFGMIQLLRRKIHAEKDRKILEISSDPLG